jgi:hypothetical protein
VVVQNAVVEISVSNLDRLSPKSISFSISLTACSHLFTNIYLLTKLATLSCYKFCSNYVNAEFQNLPVNNMQFLPAVPKKFQFSNSNELIYTTVFTYGPFTLGDTTTQQLITTVTSLPRSATSSQTNVSTCLFTVLK